MAPHDLAPAGPAAHLSNGDRELLEQGKAEHRETTAATRRALAVAEQTSELAQSTLAEAHRQGQQLAQVDHHVETIQADVKEASTLLRFMARCCCLQCSDCCDPTLAEDRTRRQRVDTRRQHSAYIQQSLAMQGEAKQQSVARLAKRSDPAYGGGEAAARSELLASATAAAAARRPPKATDLGYGLPEADRAELRLESDEQDANLDKIGDAVSGLKAISEELQQELSSQGPAIGRLQDRVAAAHDNLGGLTRQARRI